jgi:phage N-6-adenine-methyltransferase
MKTEKELRQEWRTPQDFFGMLDQEVGGFDIDVAADASNTKCWLYLDKDEDDALSMMSGWFTVKPKNGDFVHPMKAWCNPPYDNPSPWITKAFVETTNTPGSVVYMLLNLSAGTKWHTKAAQMASEMRIMAGKRLRFEPPSDDINDSSGPSQSQVLLVFRHGPAPINVFNWDWHDDLEAYRAEVGE